MKHSRIQSIIVLAVLSFSALAVLSANTSGAAANGTLSGKVTVAGARTPSNVLVYIASAPGQFSPRSPAEMDQRNLRFEPHVLPVVAGTTVNFINSDDVQHNVFTPSQAGDFFNLGTWSKGQSQSRTFTKMGKIDLLCNVHHEMRGYILVLQNPFFALTDGSGNYQIKNVPPGNYQLKVWHERASAPGQPIQVSSGVVTTNFDLAAK